ncbi:MAG: flagellar motility protein MotE (MotC chaperone) [Paracoccaceae bacterium]|jgi:flagellar motility protein MotE (MotC chaperone)
MGLFKRAHKNRGKTRRPGWLLSGLVTIFILSGLLRFGQFGMAWATAGDPVPVPTPNSETCEQLAPVEEALSLVRSRLMDLEAREITLAEREQAIGVAQEIVEQQLQALGDAGDRLENMLALSDTAAEDDLAQLTRVYESMSAADVAAVFEQMEPAFAAGFLARMQSEAAAGLLSELRPETAYSLSVLLAARNSSAPQSRRPVDETEN